MQCRVRVDSRKCPRYAQWNTCSYADDYDETCPYSGSTSPDVVYAYTADGSVTAIDVSLCNSGYDTKVFVYDNAPENLVTCDDDACGSDGFRSRVTDVPVTAGHTYYIVIDGYGAACGDYALYVTETLSGPVMECPPGSMAEGEVDCHDDYDDTYNGGCNSSPNVFTEVPCNPTASVTVCGTYGVYVHYSGFAYRDTDWYHLDPEGNLGSVVWCVTGQYSTLSGYIDATAGCGSPVFIESQVTDPFVTACFNLPAGDIWLFVATSAWNLLSMPCPGDYVMTLDGYYCTPPLAMEPTSWSRIKAEYR